jgi:hypothetical protein
MDDELCAATLAAIAITASVATNSLLLTSDHIDFEMRPGIPNCPDRHWPIAVQPARGRGKLPLRQRQLLVEAAFAILSGELLDDAA